MRIRPIAFCLGLTLTPSFALTAQASTSEAHAFGYTFTDINVPGSQPDSTDDFGLNNWGQVVGTYNDSAGNFDGFLYTGGKYVTVDAPGATDTFLYGINDLGQILGVSQNVNTGKIYVFLDTHGTFTDVADANAFLPMALNDRDQVFGEFLSGTLGYGVLTARGVITPVNLSGAPQGSAFLDGFNNRNQFTGAVCDSVTCHGIIDANGVFTEFDFPHATFTSGDGINDLGQVVGPYSDSAGNEHGFIYTNGHFTTIDDPSASAPFGTIPLLINDLGQIAGYYFDAQGNTHPFLATPDLFSFATNAAAPLAGAVPEPSTWAMMLIGLMGLGFVGLRRRASKLG
jgi:probable HAF family extracellular repeat protein